MKTQSVVQRMARSTSFKLVTVFIISSILIICIVESASKLIVDYTEQKIAIRYRTRAKLAQLLAWELDSSPDRESEAIRLGRDLDFDLRIDDTNGLKKFSTSSDIPDVTEIERVGKRRIWTDAMKSGELERLAFCIVTLKNRRYLFLFHALPLLELQLQWLSPMMALILLILLANFLLIRWLFLPVTWLSRGIHQLGEGDFNVQVPNRAFDELGDLALSFNQTVQRVRAIVESKKQLLLDVSHELRTPLTRIRVALELDGDKAKNHIRNNVLALESMIHELLESARLDSPQGPAQFEELDLTQILAATVSTFRDESPGLLLPEAETMKIKGHRKHMEICLRNVIDNALKYSKLQSNPVEIRVERVTDKLARVHIRDFGIGIPDSEKQLIFEPFYRVDKSRCAGSGGYGLGLNLCHKIMVAHGGRIFASSPRSGSGSLFTLEFPTLARRPVQASVEL
jgi:signal transduction histidine kinase